MRDLKRIAVYCGSSGQVSSVFRESAARLGRHLAQEGIGIVYGGGKVGTMGILADAALEAGGEVIGVIPDRLQALEVGHTGLTELFVVDSMSARKSMMIHLADAFIALPGGFGTLEEFAETVSLAVLNYNDKPTGLLNVDGFYDHFLKFVDHAIQSGFIRAKQREALVTAQEIGELVGLLRHQRVPKLDEWLGALQNDKS